MFIAQQYFGLVFTTVYHLLTFHRCFSVFVLFRLNAFSCDDSAVIVCICLFCFLFALMYLTKKRKTWTGTSQNMLNTVKQDIEIICRYLGHFEDCISALMSNVNCKRVEVCPLGQN